MFSVHARGYQEEIRKKLFPAKIQLRCFFSDISILLAFQQGTKILVVKFWNYQAQIYDFAPLQKLRKSTFAQNFCL